MAGSTPTPYRRASRHAREIACALTGGRNPRAGGIGGGACGGSGGARRGTSAVHTKPPSGRSFSASGARVAPPSREMEMVVEEIDE
jgi:hypothetical protein